MFIGWENGLGEHLGRATWESSLRGLVEVKNKVKKSFQWKSSLRKQLGRAVQERRMSSLEEQPKNMVE